MNHFEERKPEASCLTLRIMSAMAFGAADVFRISLIILPASPCGDRPEWYRGPKCWLGGRLWKIVAGRH